MDWVAISRLAPEASILAIAGWYSYKQNKLNQEAIDRIDNRHHEALNRLSDAIEQKLAPAVDKAGQASDKNVEVSQELLTYFKQLNGDLRKVALKKRGVKE